jgi:HAE1 family hydrophobic/amphiphilic exporter-1
VRVELDREAVQRAGTAPGAVLGTLGYQLRGSRLKDLRLDGQDMPLIISFSEPEDGAGLSWLRQTTVRSARGAQPLSSLATIRTRPGPRAIRRVDRRTQVTVRAVTSAENSALAHRSAAEVLATFPLPEGVTYEIQGSYEKFESQFMEIMKVLVLGIAFMFLLMGVLFESFLLPIAVLPSIPFAFVGGYIALLVTGASQDVTATLGSVVLAGIVVNNAIVLVDAINRALRSGLAPTRAVLAGVHDRFRPVLLTAMTTVVGLLPMAWTPASEGVMSYHALARTVIGGLMLSTAGTLVAVPLTWLLLDDLRRTVARVYARYHAS